MNPDVFTMIYRNPQLSEEDLNEVIEKHTKIDFEKGHAFLKEGEMANEYYLIQSGLLRAYVHDYLGNEITTDFHGANEISIEVSSLFQRIPSEENIVALTNGVAWRINFDDFQALFHKLEGFREWGRAWMSRQLFISKQRQIDMISKSATDRYLKLIEDKPKILEQAPVKQIASYLGVTDTSLSRIRKSISKQ